MVVIVSIVLILGCLLDCKMVHLDFLKDISTQSNCFPWRSVIYYTKIPVFVVDIHQTFSARSSMYVTILYLTRANYRENIHRKDYV